MADELPPAIQDFIADVDQYIEPLDRAIAKAEEFAAINEEVAKSLGEVGRAADEVAADMGAASHEADNLRRALEGIDAEAAAVDTQLAILDHALEGIAKNATEAGLAAEEAFNRADEAAQDARTAFLEAEQAVAAFTRGDVELGAVEAAVTKATDLLAAAQWRLRDALEAAREAGADTAGVDADLTRREAEVAAAALIEADAIGDAVTKKAEEAVAADTAANADRGMAGASALLAAAQRAQAASTDDATRAISFQMGALGEWGAEISQLRRYIDELSGAAHDIQAVGEEGASWLNGKDITALNAAISELSGSMRRLYTDASGAVTGVDAVSKASLLTADQINSVNDRLFDMRTAVVDTDESMERLATDAEYAKAVVAGLGEASTEAASGLDKASSSASSARHFFYLTAAQWQWAIRIAMEFTAVAVPALVAFGAAAADAAPAVESVYEHMKALQTASDALGDAFGTSAGQALGMSGALDRAQDAARPQIYEALGGTLGVLTGKFSSFAAGSDKALTQVKSGMGGLAQAGNQVLAAFDQFIAHFQIEMATGFGGGGLLAKMVPDLIELGQVFGNLGHIIVTVAGDMPGMAEALLKVIDGITQLVKWATSLGAASHYIILFYMSLEEVGHWGPVVVSILDKLGLATKVFQSTEGMNYFQKLGAGGINFAATLGGVIPKAIGAAVSGIGMLIGQFQSLSPALENAAARTMEAGSAITAFANDAKAMAGLGVLVGVIVAVGVEMDRTRSSTQQWIDTMNRAVASANQLTVLNTLASSIGEATMRIQQQQQVLSQYPAAMRSYAEANAQGSESLDHLLGPMAGVQRGAQNFGNAVNTWIGHAISWVTTIKSVGNAYIAMTGANGAGRAALQIEQLTAQQQQWVRASVNVVQGAAAISHEYGVNFTGALELAQQAGVKLQAGFVGQGQDAIAARLQVADLVAGYKAMGQTGTAISGDMEVLAVQSGLAATKVQQLTQATQAYMQDVTGGTAGLAGYVQSIENLGTVVGKAGSGIGNLGNAASINLGKVSSFAAALKNMGGQGAQAWTNFDQVVGQTLPNLIGWFQTAGAMGVMSGQKIKQGTLDALSGIVPYAQGNKAAEASVLALARTTLGTSTTWSELSAKIKDTHASMSAANEMVQSTTARMGNLMQVAQNLGNVMSSSIVTTMDQAKLSASGLAQESASLADALHQPGVSADTLRDKATQLLHTMEGLTGSKSAAENFLHAWLNSFGQTGQALWNLLHGVQQNAPKIPQSLKDAATHGGPSVADAYAHMARSVTTAFDAQNLPGHMQAKGQESSTQFLHGLDSKTAEITKWASTVNTSVKGELQHLPPAATAAGKDAGQGLAQGLNSEQGAVQAAAAKLASEASAAMRNALKSHSPSQVTMQIGKDAGTGLALGMTSELGAVQQASQQLANAAAGGWGFPGWGSGGGAFDRWVKIGKETVGQLIKGLTGSVSQVKKAVDDITKAVDAELTKGMTAWQKQKFHQLGAWADPIVGLIDKDNKKLQSLANERDRIMNQIKKAEQYAKSTASSLIGATGLAGLTQPTNPTTGATLPWTVPNIQSQMSTQLNQLKAFDHNIDVLKKMGLNKTLLNQIIAAGYQQGGALAQALAHGSESQIKSLNSTEEAIIKASKKIGKDAANAMYDTGKNAGKGFLSGLKSQEKEIEKEMDKIAKDMIKAIEKALKIKSPSQEMYDRGMWAAQGLAKGLLDGEPIVLSAAKKLAAAVGGVKIGLPATPVAHPGGPVIQIAPGAPPAGVSQPLVIVHQHIAGSVLSEQQLQQYVQSAQLKYTHRNLGNGLYLPGRASGTPAR